MNYYTYIVFTRGSKVFESGVSTDLKITLELMNETRTEKAVLVYYETFDSGKEAAERAQLFEHIPVDLLRQFVKENNPSMADLSGLIDHKSQKHP